MSRLFDWFSRRFPSVQELVLFFFLVSTLVTYAFMSGAIYVLVQLPLECVQ